MNITEGLKALFAVQAVIPRALLSGGYLRDSILGRPVKDIDIYVPASATVAQIESVGGKAMVGAAEYMEQTEVDGIYDVAGFALPVQIIRLAPGLDPVDRAKANDFGICQVWHDGTEMGTTEFFTQDVGAQTFTLVDCDSSAEYARSMRRWERLKAKYPEFRLVVPEPHRQFDILGALA